MRVITVRNRYTKQRKYNPNTELVVKFMPKEFALVLASIILYVKPAEAEFACELFGTNPCETSEFLFTVEGRPADPKSMTAILSETYADFGFIIHISDFRFVILKFTSCIFRRNVLTQTLLQACLGSICAQDLQNRLPIRLIFDKDGKS
jgi:hypothetical protein